MRRLLAVGMIWAVVLLVLAVPGSAQAPPFSNTLRYGTGYFDVPAAVVLPGAALRVGFSGFRTSAGDRVVVGPDGQPTGVVDPRDADIHGDLSLSLGLFNRIEVGTTLQSFADEDDGGRLTGFFGRVLLVDPSRSGFGLAAGARYLSAPTVDPGSGRVAGAPTRLGFGDPRLLRSPQGADGIDTRLSLYGVASLFLPGVQASWIPENTVSLSVGYGTGAFQEGGELSWYAPPGWDGWFMAGSMDVQLSQDRALALKAEHNGFDVNAGLELALGGVRAGVFVLGLNHDESGSVYRSRKLGISLSFTACPILRVACRPRVRRAHQPDTVVLPAPPPDTVIIRRGGRSSVGELLQNPVQRVQDGDGGAARQTLLRLARLGAQEPVLPVVGQSPDGGDDHPRVEGANRFHTPEFGANDLTEDAVDGVEGSPSPHAQVALRGEEASGYADVWLALELHAHRYLPMTVGRLGGLKVEETEAYALRGRGRFVGTHGARMAGDRMGGKRVPIEAFSRPTP